MIVLFEVLGFVTEHGLGQVNFLLVGIDIICDMGDADLLQPIGLCCCRFFFCFPRLPKVTLCTFCSIHVYMVCPCCLSCIMSGNMYGHFPFPAVSGPSAVDQKASFNDSSIFPTLLFPALLSSGNMRVAI